MKVLLLLSLSILLTMHEPGVMSMTMQAANAPGSPASTMGMQDEDCPPGEMSMQAANAPSSALGMEDEDCPPGEMGMPAMGPSVMGMPAMSPSGGPSVQMGMQNEDCPPGEMNTKKSGQTMVARKDESTRNGKDKDKNERGHGRT